MAGKIGKPVVRDIHGNKCLIGKNKVLFENGVCIDKEEFDAVKDECLAERIASATRKESGWDWDYACETGELQRNKARTKKTVFGDEEEFESEEPAEITETEAKTEEIITESEDDDVLKNNTSEVLENNTSKWYDNITSATILLPAMVFVGIGGAVMSVINTAVFLLSGGRGAFPSVFTAVTLIVFSATAFTAARYFFKEKNAFFGVLFYVMGFAVIAYSILSTISVQYDAYQRTLDENNRIAIETSSEKERAEKTIERNIEALKKLDEDIAYYKEQVSYWADKSWARRDDAQKKLDDAIARRNELQDAAIERTEEQALKVEKKETVFEFLSRLFGISIDVLNFMTYAIPGVFFDVICPTAISVTLLLIDIRRRGRNE